MLQIRDNVPLAPLTTFKVGGPAKKYVCVSTVEELQEALALAKKGGWKFFILGGGSNLIVSSKGFDGLVIHLNISTIITANRKIIAGAGAVLADVVKVAIEEGFSGLEWAGGLPGTFGGAIRGNAGAFGGEMKDNIESVSSIDPDTGELSTYSNAACNFEYRGSRFKKNEGEIIVTGTIKLSKGNPETIKAGVDSHIEYRHKNHPMEFPCAGSVFKNVPIEDFPREYLKPFETFIKNDPFPIIPVARIILAAGLSGTKQGGAELSTKHCNFIINKDKAKPEDITALIRQIRQAVMKKYGIELEIEQELVGF